MTIITIYYYDDANGHEDDYVIEIMYPIYLCGSWDGYAEHLMTHKVTIDSVTLFYIDIDIPLGSHTYYFKGTKYYWIDKPNYAYEEIWKTRHTKSNNIQVCEEYVTNFNCYYCKKSTAEHKATIFTNKEMWEMMKKFICTQCLIENHKKLYDVRKMKEDDNYNTLETDY